eukprot:9473558-Ditylum_brightwellii.AAC.1
MPSPLPPKPPQMPFLCHHSRNIYHSYHNIYTTTTSSTTPFSSLQLYGLGIERGKSRQQHNDQRNGKTNCCTMGSTQKKKQQ